MDLATKIEKTEFLGFEFLAWLACRSDTGLGILADEKDPSMELWVAKKVVLAEPAVRGEQTAIRAEEPAGSFEAKTSMRLGKWIEECQFSLIHNDIEWSFGVGARDLKLRTVKIKSEFKKGEEGAVLDRVSLLEDLLFLWDQFYQRFITLRVDPDAWPVEVARIREWVLA